MSVEVLPARKDAEPVVLDGYTTDLSVSGLSLIADIDAMEDTSDLYTFLQGAVSHRVRVTLPYDGLSVAIGGQIIRSRKVIVDGSKTLALGIQFDEIPPRLRGAFFSIAGYGDAYLNRLSA
jgi:hypothetical protein